jgi:hypothetical protein
VGDKRHVLGAEAPIATAYNRPGATLYAGTKVPLRIRDYDHFAL